MLIPNRYDYASGMEARFYNMGNRGLLVTDIYSAPHKLLNMLYVNKSYIKDYITRIFIYDNDKVGFNLKTLNVLSDLRYDDVEKYNDLCVKNFVFDSDGLFSFCDDKLIRFCRLHGYDLWGCDDSQSNSAYVGNEIFLFDGIYSGKWIESIGCEQKLIELAGQYNIEVINYRKVQND